MTIVNPRISSYAAKNFRAIVRKASNSTSHRSKAWESVVGLEVHAQIAAASKLFSGSGTAFSAPVNTQVSFFDAGHPGTLPVLNERCVEAGILTALALGCTVNKMSMFDRKHYFYADLPVGYQITQQHHPLAENGRLSFVTSTLGNTMEPYPVETRIKQIQLEQDSGRSLHDFMVGCSLIDLNRAGVPLMEIVFEPDLKNGEEAASLLRELHAILLKLGTCNCKMEEGSMRVDANVSVNKPHEAMGIRTEIKNLNSIRTVSRAINYEISRQISVLEQGGIIENETRMFDYKTKTTVGIRDKEKVQDYRFMPEPNLPPLLLCDDNDNLEIKAQRIDISKLQSKIPELPAQRRLKLMTEYNLPLKAAILLANEKLLHYFYCLTTKDKSQAQQVVKFLNRQLVEYLNQIKKSVDDCSLDASKLEELFEIQQSNVISLETSQQVLILMINGDSRSPYKIVDENQLKKITDEVTLKAICQETINNNEKLMKSMKKDPTKVMYTLVGYVKKATNYRADHDIAMRIIKSLLEK